MVVDEKGEVNKTEVGRSLFYTELTEAGGECLCNIQDQLAECHWEKWNVNFFIQSITFTVQYNNGFQLPGSYVEGILQVSFKGQREQWQTVP